RFAATADVIVVEDYDKGVMARPVIDAVASLGRSLDRPVVVDPKARHFFDYGGCTVLKPNRVELAAAMRAPVPADDNDAMESIRRRLGCANLLVTLGEQGMVLVPEGGEVLRVPSTARSVFDVSGAGDTVVAVVALALAAGATVEEAAVLANFAAGLGVAKSGVATVGPEELAESIRSTAVYA
ncbi:MAG TPA: PfkB family carbohydrate kinase, partial [Longimicrobiales bacterium]|nr:PfkB family carbohydrate kinase [Longimicrobiales bacterium]